MRFFLPSLLCASLLASSFSFAENIDDIYRATIDNNPLLLGAEAKLKSNEEIANIAKGALLPSIGAQITYGLHKVNSAQDFSTSVNAFGNTVQPDSESNSRSMDLYGQIGISQTLVNFYSWYNFKGAKKISEKAQLEFASTQQSLIVRTVEQYLNVLRAEELLTTSKAEEEAVAQRLEQTKQRYHVGLAAVTEVNEAQAAYDLTHVAKLASEGNLQVAYEMLSILTGKQHTKINGISPNFPVIALTENSDSWVKLALEHNLDLQQAEKTKEGAEYALKASRSNHYPVLSAQASYSNLLQKGEMGNSQYGGLVKFTDDHAKITNDTTMIGLNLTIPIYTGGSTSASVRKSAAEEMMASEGVNGLRRTISQQIRALHIASLTRMQQVDARKQAIISSQSALDAIQAGYEVGTRNIVDVLNAQRYLYAAERDYADARFDYILNIFQLKQVAGVLSPADISSLNQWTIQ